MSGLEKQIKNYGRFSQTIARFISLSTLNTGLVPEYNLIELAKQGSEREPY